MRLFLGFLVAAFAIAPVTSITRDQSGYAQIAFADDDAYVFGAWVAMDGETADSLFEWLLDPINLKAWAGTSIEEDFQNVKRDGTVGGVGWTTGFRWEIEYHGVKGEAWVIPADGRIYTFYILDNRIRQEGSGEAGAYEPYFQFLRDSVTVGGFGEIPAGFELVGEDPNCVGHGQAHPFCPFLDLVAGNS